MAGDRVLHMNSGTGETSYAKNSTHQRKTILKVKPIIEESLNKMLHHNNFGDILKVADLGCSSESTAFMVISVIINIIDNTIGNMDCEPPMLQLYLNDLFENDFNNIFKSLPNFYQSMQQERIGKVGSFFINATPGNFYGRLFPNNFINFFHSSYSLHWLSQAPKELSEGLEAVNKGNIYITNKRTHRAYLEQFQRDLKLFLRLRCEELKPGGVMVLTLIGRSSQHVPHINDPWVLLGTVLHGMVLEGLVEEAKLDFFNLPIYGPAAEEVKQVIEVEGSFNLQTLESIKIGWDANLQDEYVDLVIDTNTRGEFTAKSIRAVFEPLLEVVFGKNIMDELFSRFAKEVAKLMETETSLEYTNLVLSMTKGP